MVAQKVNQKTREYLVGLLVAQGVAGVLFGIAALFWPGLTVSLLVTIFGVFMVVAGVIGLVHSLLGVGRDKLWWLELLMSVLIVGLGVYLLRNVGVALALFILLVGFTFVLRGIYDVVAGLFGAHKDEEVSRWLHVVAGVIGVLAGVIVLSHPAASGLVFVWAVGLYALLRGAIDIGLAFRLNAEG